MVNLLSAPRLPRPVWLGLTSDTVTSRQRQRLAELFVAELTSLIAQLDTKEHNWSDAGRRMGYCYIGRVASCKVLNLLFYSAI